MTVYVPFDYNRDVARRNAIMGLPSDIDADPRYKEFRNLAVDALQLLVNERFADPSNRQNEAPATGVFLALMRQQPRIKAHGYVIGTAREDYRVAIEGVACDLLSAPVAERSGVTRAFRSFVKQHKPDTKRVTASNLCCWWD